jgi:hypothetical protein
MNRDDIIHKHKQRRNAEQALKHGISDTQKYLHPRAIGQRLLKSQKQKLSARSAVVSHFASENKRWFAAGGLLILLISARLPISQFVIQLRDRASKNKVQ